MKNNNPNISKASVDQLSEIMELYLACAKNMNAKGLYNWSEDYPDVKTVNADIETGSLFVYREGKLKGVVALNQSQPDAYEQIAWEYTSPEYLVVNRLAIDPEYQRNGIAREIMHFVENYAAKQHFTSIRLDVYSISQAARLLYRKLQFKEICEFHFPDIELPFIAMEKAVATSKKK